MFKAVGNLQTNNGKRLVKWATGQMRLGRPEPLWFDAVARLHPPLSFATAPCGHRQQETTTKIKPELIVFPEDNKAAGEVAPVDREMPITLGTDTRASNGRASNVPVEQRLRVDAEHLSKQYLVEEQVVMRQDKKIASIRNPGKYGKRR